MSTREEVLKLAPYANKTEIAKIVGVTHQRVSQIIRDAKGPRPLYCICETCGKEYQRHCDNAGRFCSSECVNLVKRSADFVMQARTLWDAGHPVRVIAERMGVKPNVISGISWRHKFTRRPSPIRRAA